MNRIVYVESGDDELDGLGGFKPGVPLDRVCCVCPNKVGWVETESIDRHNNDQIAQEWFPFLLIQFEDDEEPTYFCEDDYTWLEQVSDLLQEYRKEAQQSI